LPNLPGIFGPAPALELRALTIGQDYSLAIEAFDESGVSKPSKPVNARAGR